MQQYVRNMEISEKWLGEMCVWSLDCTCLEYERMLKPCEYSMCQPSKVSAVVDQR